MENTKALVPENTEQPGTDKTDAISLQGIREAHLGSKIRAIRKSQGVKQETLATLVKATQSKISAIELTGEVDSRTLKRIADALEVSVDFIKRFEPEEAVYQVQNNYNAQRVGLEFNDDESMTNSHNTTTNTLDVIQHMTEFLKESYHMTIAKLDSMITKQEETIRELKAENRELRTKK